MSLSKSRGLINDSISDMLTRIRNATLAKKSSVSIPFTNLNQELAQVLEKEGFIQSFQLSGPVPAYSYSYSDSPIVPAPSKGDIVIRLKYSSKEIYKGKTKESCITNLQRMSKPGLRIYANYREIPRILSGAGIVIISTPSGIMTDREARARKLGGELLCSVW
jgi:small subunit ribosomal protein S8